MATTNIFTEKWSKRVLDAITQNTGYTNGLRGSNSSTVYLALLKNKNLTSTPPADAGQPFPVSDSLPYGNGTDANPANRDNDKWLNEFTDYTIVVNGQTDSSNRPAVAFGTVTVGTPPTATQNCTNTGAVTFTIQAGGQITGIAICEASLKSTALNTTHASGNVIWYGEVAANITVAQGNTLTFNAGQITISLG